MCGVYTLYFNLVYWTLSVEVAFYALVLTWVQKWAMHMGALSYGVYLLHSLVLVLMSGIFVSEFLHVLASTLVTLLLAAFLYHWFELPCRNYGRRN